MTATKAELVEVSDVVWRRLRTRLDGLSDDEYLWEPAPGCWTVRARADGSWRADGTLPPPEPAPFTTIAWRLWHLVDMYGEDRAPRWLDVAPQGAPIGPDDPAGEPPTTATAAIDLLEQAHDRWDAHLALAPEERLQDVVGPVAGPYADRTRAAYVLHMLDEFIHHGAEVALLRDLWRWRHALLADDPLVERVIRGDRGVLDDLRGDAPARGRAIRERPDLVGRAAAHGRWDLVVGLVALGFPVDSPGRTALHTAAGAGELEVVQALVAAGADPTATDEQFHATPLQWAQFLHRDAVADWLSSRAGAAP
jgi:hypothetical protein